jgi:hypothetical protein
MENLPASEAGKWWGVRGVHRTDLNQTFIRGQFSRKFHRLRWV